jgi:hypothetical protein
VRRLQAFLLEHLDAEARAELDRELLAEHYCGDFHVRLLEYCLHDDPVTKVADRFPLHRLRALVRTLTGRVPPPDRNGRELAQDILSHLGFPRPATPLGLNRIAREVLQALHTIDADDGADPAALVNRVARHLEYLMHVLVRFMSQTVFQQPPERLLDLEKPLAAHGLGELFVAGMKLQRRLRDAREQAARVFDRDFTQYSVLPTGTGSLSKIRNSLSHFREVAASGPDAAGSADEPLSPRSRARRFLVDTKALLDHLADERMRVFPQVVRVDGVEVDRWNRRIVRVLDDDGGKDLLFTDVQMEPGRIYFMHAISNPLRVDPLLVPAGNLIWADEP